MVDSPSPAASGPTKELDAAQKTMFQGLTSIDSPEDISLPEAPVEEPILVIPLDGTRDAEGSWKLSVPAATSAKPAIKWLQQLRADGKVQLPDELIERIAVSAVDPSEIEGNALRRIRTENGWVMILEVRLFTTLVNVSVANDRWVADATYQADPNFTGKNELLAVPMPKSDADFAILRYDDPTADLLEAAEQNYYRILKNNPQDVGRRLIELPVTLVPTIFGNSGAGNTSTELAAVDGNSRLSSAFHKLKVRVDALPAQLRGQEAYRSVEELPLTPAMLANLKVTERKALVRTLIRQCDARLVEPAKSHSARGYTKDLSERNQAAATLNILTVPARIVVGYIDDDQGRYGMSRFASAVRALLMQMNVEVKPLDESAKNAIEAEEVVLALHEEGLIDKPTYDVLIGRDRVAESMETLGLDPKLPDLRAALVFQVLCSKDKAFNSVLREKLRKRQIHVKDRSNLAVELALRSYTASLDPDAFKQARTALETGALWQDLVSWPWQVVNINSDDDIDALEMYAHEQLAGGGGICLRLLGVLGMLALVTTGNLLAPRGSAEVLVANKPIDRGSVGQIIDKITRHDWGITLLADAIKRARAGDRKLRWISKDDGSLEETPDDWKPAHFDANLRLAAKLESVHPAVIPGSTQERVAWTVAAQSIQNAKTKVIDFLDLRKQNATVEKVPWLEVEAAVVSLDSMLSNIKDIAAPRPLEQ